MLDRLMSTFSAYNNQCSEIFYTTYISLRKSTCTKNVIGLTLKHYDIICNVVSAHFSNSTLNLNMYVSIA